MQSHYSLESLALLPPSVKGIIVAAAIIQVVVLVAAIRRWQQLPTGARLLELPKSGWLAAIIICNILGPVAFLIAFRRHRRINADPVTDPGCTGSAPDRAELLGQLYPPGRNPR